MESPRLVHDIRSALSVARRKPEGIESALSVAQREPEDIQCKLSHLNILLPPLRKHWKRAVMAVITLLLASLLALPMPYVQKIILDDVLPSGDRVLLVRLILALFGLHVFQVVLSLTRGYNFTVLSQDTVISLKQKLFERILRLPCSFFDRNQVGYLMARLQEVQGVGSFFSGAVVGFFTMCLEFLLSLGIMFYMDWRLTLICCAVLPVYYWLMKFNSSSLRSASLNKIKRQAEVSQDIQEALSGMKVVKAFAAEQRESDQMRSRLKSFLHSSVVYSLISSFYSQGIQLVSGIAGLLLLWYAGNRIISGAFTIGKYVAFAGYMKRLFGPVKMIAMTGMMLQAPFVALARVAELFGLLTEEEDPRRTEHVQQLQGVIEISNLSFSYDDTEEDLRRTEHVQQLQDAIEMPNLTSSRDKGEVLRDVNLRIVPGQKVAIVGPSGSGKTTILKLLLGFYRPPDGTVWIDGKDINTLTLSELRERIGVVSQDIFLFNDTVHNNICYSRPEATKEEIVRAAELADAHDFIMAMPRGYDMPVGERAALLSGGQRQRISIARAILKDPDLVIFDEAMSDLDAETEQRIWRQIDGQFSDKTCIVVAHRLSTIVSADLIYVLDQGKIVQQGSHEELLATSGRYQELYSAQAVAAPSEVS